MAGERSQVRLRLLNIHGIGPETADSMMLYAGGHAILSWMPTRDVSSQGMAGVIPVPLPHAEEICQNGIQAWQARTSLRWKAGITTAQLVQIGKDFVALVILCDLCPLQSLL